MNRIQKIIFGALLELAILVPSMVQAQIFTPTGGIDGPSGAGNNVTIGSTFPATPNPYALYLGAPISGGFDFGGTQELLLRTHVWDSYDYMDILNGTFTSGDYYPVIQGYRQSEAFAPSISLLGSGLETTIDATASNGIAYPMMQFEVRAYSVGVSGSVDRPSGVVMAIHNRPLFDWTDAGVVMMRMVPTGSGGTANVGIGTGSALGIGSKLTVFGDGNSSGVLDVEGNSSGTAPLIVAQTNGNVGVGLSSPTATLDVNGNSSIPALRVMNGNAGINASSPSSRLVVNGSSSQSSLDVQNSGTSALIVTSNGNIGMSSTSPSARLEIKGAGSGSGSSTTALNVLDNSSSTPLLAVRDNGNVVVGTSTASGKVTVSQTGSNGGSNIYSSIAGSATAGGIYGIRSSATGNGSANYGFYGEASQAPLFNVGGHFEASDGGYTPDWLTGVEAIANNSNSSCATAIYGIYASVSGSACNAPSTTQTMSKYAGYFDGDVLVGGTFYNSDRKLKNNILPFDGALQQIAKLSSKTYEFRTKDFPSMQLPEGQQIGLIAQDVEQIFPNLVKYAIHPPVRDKDGKILQDKVEFKAVNYVGLVPVLVRGIQEQQQQIDSLKQQAQQIADLKQQVADLTNAVIKLTSPVSSSQPAQNGSSPVLYQNMPNPTNSSTVIRYFVPQGVRAQMVITDLQQRTEIQRTNLESGNGQVIIAAGSIPPGLYLYSLIVNGASVDSKKMVINQ